MIKETVPLSDVAGPLTNSSPTFPGGFTVLMAVHCDADPELFERAVDSVYGNTLKPDDFILVADGPVPETIRTSISLNQEARGMRVIWLSENMGLAHALNRGLEFVRTTWVVRADADDVNMLDRFASQAAAVIQSADSIDLIGGAIIEVDHSGAAVAIRNVPAGHDEIVRRLRLRSPFNHMTVAYRTALVLQAGGYPSIYRKEDYALWACMISRGARCRNVSDVLVRATTGRDMYRRRGGWRYAKSEWDLQIYLWRLRQKGLLSAFFCWCLRATVFSLPAVLRGWIYERLLRNPPNAFDS